MKGFDRRQNQIMVCLMLGLGVPALLLLYYYGGIWLENRAQETEARGEFHMERQNKEDTITVNGTTYQRRKNMTTILMMGIDRQTNQRNVGNRNGGQADFLRLIVIDGDQEQILQVQINRDTMTDIEVLGVLGEQAGVRNAQISLSHAFGDGGEQSNQLTVEAVSRLLLDLPIDFYVAMNLDGIGVLNDLVGGVTITLEEDFSEQDPEMAIGATLTLSGEQAERYVRGRLGVGSGTNISRMGRQEQYLAALWRMVEARQREDGHYLATLYDAMTPYLTTNLSRGQLINESWRTRSYGLVPVLKLSGRSQIGPDGFEQFIVDEAALPQTVMTLFYTSNE